MDRTAKAVAAGFIIVIALLAASCVVNAMTDKVAVAILEGFTAAAWTGILIAWCWFNRRRETRPK